MRLACSCHVSRQDGYNPADLGDRAGLEEEKAADELLVVSQQGGIGSGRHILERYEYLVELAGARCFGRIAVGHVPTCEELVDVELLGCGNCARVRIASILGAKIPADRSFIVEADAFVAVCSEVLAEGVAVGEYQVVVDVRDNDQDGRVVGTIGVHAIINGQGLEMLSQVVEVDVRGVFSRFGVVDVLDVNAAVGDEARKAVAVAHGAPELVPCSGAVDHAVEAAVE